MVGLWWRWGLGLVLFCGVGQGAGEVMAIGHRGFMAQAPENTIASFAAAQAVGAAYVEVDVRAMRDGVLVLVHDATVDRTTARRGAVAEMPYATLREWGVVRFREALAWARQAGMRVDVDHKAGDVDAIAAEIRETGMTDRVVIEGSRERLARFAALLPGVDTMPKVRSLAEVAEVCAVLRTTVIRLSIEQLAEAEYAEAVRRCGARIAVTLLGERDREEEMRRVIGLGAQLIETDASARGVDRGGADGVAPARGVAAERAAGAEGTRRGSGVGPGVFVCGGA